jgi:hypothetical protein
MTMLRDKRGYQIGRQELYGLLGIRGDHLPFEGVAPIKVFDSHGTGMLVMCEPEGGFYDHMSGQKVKRPHRVRCLCEACGTWVPFGRMAQHNKKHDGRVS